MANTIKIKRGLSTNAGSLTLQEGELAVTTDTHDLYVGSDGSKIKLNDISSKQDTLVSGTNIKTVNEKNILGSGNLELTASDVGALPSSTVIPSKISDLTDDTAINPVDKADTLTGLTATANELNVLDGITATTTELNYVDGVTSNIQTQLNNKEDADETILKQADVIDNTTSTSTIEPLSANQGKVLQTEIDNLKNIGRFLAIWNCTTGLPTSNPSSLPYVYKSGDYFRVGMVAGTYIHALTATGSTTDQGIYEGTYTLSLSLTTQDGTQLTTVASIIAALEDGERYTATGTLTTTDETYTIVSVLKWTQDSTNYLALCDDEDSKLALVLESTSQTDTVTGGNTNYKPNGSTYTGVASTTIDTDTVGVGDVYYYDGVVWMKQASSGGGTVQDVQINGSSILSSGIANIPYASGSDFGVIKTSNYYATSTSSGILTSQNLAYSAYEAKSNLAFVSKGTLENVLLAKNLSQTTTIDSSSTNSTVPGTKAVYDKLALKQDTLVSGTSIKTINNQSLLGSGDITVGGSVEVDDETISENSSNELQTIGIIDGNTSSADKVWTGTLAEYNAIATKDADTFYYITDDNTEKEVVSNKVVSISASSTNTQYPSAKLLYDQLLNKQNTLVSGTNIKTINSGSILGTGDLLLADRDLSNLSSTGESHFAKAADLTVKQNITDNTLTTTNKTIPLAINEVNSIAKGANQALGYSNYSSLITAFNSLDSSTYKVGQNIYVVTTDVPDLWVSSVESSSSTYTYTTDDQVVSDLETNGYIQCGYYKLSMLETQKVDLTNYITKTTYATTSSSGVVVGNTATQFLVNSYGKPYGGVTAYSSYDSASTYTFISKGTLENVLTGKGLIKATTISSSSTDSNVVTPKAVYDYAVAKVSGKDLSTNDYTTVEKTKLAGIADGAQTNVWGTITGTLSSQTDLNTALTAKAPINNATFTGITTVANNTSYTTKQVRNIFCSTADPTSSDGANGDIWFKYDA